MPSLAFCHLGLLNWALSSSDPAQRPVPQTVGWPGTLQVTPHPQEAMSAEGSGSLLSHLHPHLRDPCLEPEVGLVQGTGLLQVLLGGKCQGLWGILLKERNAMVSSHRPSPCQASACMESRPPRSPSPSAPGGKGSHSKSFRSLASLSPPSKLVRGPAWFSQAMLMPYVHTTDAFSCLSRGT